MLSVVMLSAFVINLPSVVMLSVVAPVRVNLYKPFFLRHYGFDK